MSLLRRSGLLVGLLAWLLVPSSSPAQSGFRYVHPADPACGGQSPCYATIQAAVNAATAGEHVVVQAGTYQEQVAVTGKNNTAGATEADRIVIQADPAASVGSVILQGAVSQCTNGHAVRFQQSKFVTLRGLTITGAGGAAVSLMGGNNDNEAIHLERLRILGNGSGSCDGGITIARGNPGTLVLNSLIHGNGRNGVSTIDADGGPHYLIGNTIHANEWSGVSVTRTHETFLVNNAITGNGTAAGSTGGRFGVKRESSTSPQPAGIHLLNNLICGNRLGEIDGPALDATDSGNLTPTGSEGPGVAPSAGCETAASVYADVDGSDGVVNTGDDDFTPVTGSPLLDAGLDPRTLGLAPAFDALLEADYLAPAARPRLGTAGSTAQFDIGAREPDIGDEIAPLVTIVAPPTDSYVRLQVAVEAQATDDGTGVATLALRIGTQPLTATLVPSLPPPAVSVTATATWNTTAFADGTHTLTAEAEDAAGNPGSASRVLIVDNTPPETSITDGPSGEVATTSVTFGFAGSDNLTAAPSLQFSWRLDGGAWSAFGGAMTVQLSGLSEAEHTFEVKARDLAGNEDPSPAARTFIVRLGPSITGVEPASGPIGTFVTISGTNFQPGATTVTFNGTAAVVRPVTPTQITTTVPPGATTGPLVVTTSQGTPASVAFTVTLTGDFTLAATPATVRVIAGDQAAVSVAATGAGAFTNLVALSVPAPPAGVTPTFDSTFLAPGASTTLSFAVPASLAPGIHPVTVRGQAGVDGQPLTRTAAANLEVLAPGTTAVTGRIMTAETVPQPIPGVTVALGSAFVLTDAAGNFVLLAPPPGPNMLFVDGRTASTPTAQFPIVEVQVDVAAVGVTRVPFTIYLPILDTANAVDLPLDANGFTTQEVKATTPAIPGLVVTVPQGTRIIGPDGNPVAQLVITPVPVDRSPMPFPAGVVPPLLFAINPGGAVPSQPLPITFPNPLQASPGAAADLYYFDLVAGTWSIWGQGTVTADGTQIASNPGAGLPRLAWHFAFRSTSEQIRERHATGGDPVDLVTGRFKVKKTDLALPGRIPVTVQRTYHNGDLAPGPFGIGWNLAPYDMVIAEAGSGPSRRLVLADQSAYLLTQVPGGGWRNSGEPFLAGAVLTALPGDFNFELRYKDGIRHRFTKITGFNAAALTAIEDRNGNVLTVQRSTTLFDRRILSITQPGGRQLAFLYDAAGRVIQLRDPIGRSVTYTYDAASRLETVADPAGGVTRYTYDSDHRIVSITDARGIVSLTNEYNADHRVIRQNQADGGIWEFSYFVPAPAPTGEGGCTNGPCAAPPLPPPPSTTVTDPRGNRTTHRFGSGLDVLLGRGTGFTSAIRNALGQTTLFDTLGMPITDPLGRTSRPEYDPSLNLVKLTDAAGHDSIYTYEPTFNRLTSVTDPLGHTARFEYDSRGNLTATVDPLEKRTTISYDSVGQPTSITDPLGHPTTFDYDPHGNLTSVTDPLGHTTTRHYDLVGRLLRQVDPRGKSSAFAYDPHNRLTTITDALGGVTRLTYDPNGNLLTVTDPRGGITTYTYDSMDRVTSRTDSLGAVETFEYDMLGNLARHADRRGLVATFGYDALNRRTAATYVDGSITFEYDAAGRLVSLAEDVGARFVFGYDALDRLILESGPLGRVSYSYDAAGRRVQLFAPGAPPTAYAYDAASRLTTLTQGPTAVGFSYDDADRRTRVTLPHGFSTEYQYDAASRVTGLVYRNAAGVLGDLSYAYDAVGNRLAVAGSFARIALPSSISAATYDAANRQRSFGDATLDYDANGSLRTLADIQGTTEFTWDARGRLVSVSGPSEPLTFTHDALGRRAALRSGAGHAEYFVHDGDSVIQQVTDTSASTFVRSLHLDEVLTRDATTLYLSAAPSSTIALATADGLIATEYTYEPFGAAVVQGAPDLNRFQFNGRETDTEGLVYNRARYYSPRLHRFLAEDPFGLRGGVNRYAYALNNPVVLTDPLGLKVDLTNVGRLRGPLERVRQTRRGRELYEMLDAAPDRYTIREWRPSDGPDRAFYDPVNREVVVDPSFRPTISVAPPSWLPQWLPWWTSASTDRIVGHELGHAATGASDREGPPPGRNAIENENPIAVELGQRPRVRY